MNVLVSLTILASFLSLSNTERYGVSAHETIKHANSNKFYCTVWPFRQVNASSAVSTRTKRRKSTLMETSSKSMKLRFSFSRLPFDVQEPCRHNWYLFRDRCYMISIEKETWDKAEFMCRAFGGHLAEIHDEPTNTFIKDTVKTNNKNTNNHHYFIGLKDEAQFDRWEWWQSSQVVNFTNWGTHPHQQPDHWASKEHCVLLYQNDAYTWHDANCNDNNFFICEEAAIESTEVIG